jgi:HEAT repeat protein
VVAIPSLRDVAINDANAELRKSALYAIADIEGDDSVKALVDIFNSSPDPGVQESALYAISDHGGKTAEQLLYNTALNHPNEKLAKAAVYALADQTHDESMMLDIVRKSTHPEVKKAALQGILDSGDEVNSVKALTEVLKTEKDNDLRVSTGQRRRAAIPGRMHARRRGCHSDRDGRSRRGAGLQL